MLVLTYGLESWPYTLGTTEQRAYLSSYSQQDRGLAHPDK